MAEPSVVYSGASTFSDNGNVTNTVAGVSWATGDIVVVLGANSNNGIAASMATPTVTGLSGTGLTFAAIPGGVVNNNTANDDTQCFSWSATAAGAGSGTISGTASANTAERNGFVVFVCSGSDGLGTPVLLDGSTAKTISLTRAQANSHVWLIMADWNQVGDVTVTATPTGTVRLASAQAGQADFFVVSFGDQGATGTTAYGIASHTGTVDMSGIAIEIKGTAGGGAADQPYRKRTGGVPGMGQSNVW